ncbi:hexamerine [Trichophyton violaceum]|uniref:Hexamerine n=1 Tax=Trichophyton violaceum TaxID=34388 RepID=A0A178F977_TRIVO|nr:hexamerine [Trichophyton violaceum]
MAHELKSHRLHNVEHMPHVQMSDDNVVIEANYTGWYMRYNDEQKMAYYTEDIGLQLFYYNNHLDYPFWLGGEEFKLYKDRRGEMYYYKHMQLLARYYLERLSNGLGEIPVMTTNTPVVGFNPSLTYDNGLVFPIRSNGYVPLNPVIMKYLEKMHQIEQRIADAVSSMYIVTENAEMLSIKKPEGIEILGNIVEGNPDSKNLRYYKRVVNIALSVYGSGVVSLPTHRNHIAPSVLEHYQTAMRDPMFYQIYKGYMQYFMEYKNQLPHYTREELLSSGVKVMNVEVDKLMTYFEPVYANISNVMYLDEHEVKNMMENLHVLVRQMRINHKPFNTKITVKSEVAKTVYVKLFLGPKYDNHGLEIPLNENRFNFVELDEFKYEMKQGDNIIVRNSQDSVITSEDPTSSAKMYQQVMQALDGAATFHLDMTEDQSEWPQRLMLPKGTKSGMPFIVYVHIGDYVEAKVPFGKGFDPAISNGTDLLP